jgi:hypothetical protein
MDGMTDDQFEQFLQREARAYNAPPANVPREEMWTRVDAELRARRAGSVQAITHRRLIWAAGAALAAALVLGVGIGYELRQRVEPQRVAQQRQEQQQQREPEQQRQPAADALTSSTPRSVSPQLRPPAPDSRAAYAAFTVEHLGRAEALLTSFRAESERGTVDPQVTAWAGDLLGTTRLLLDSPGASDPRLHNLLGDLELVLTQITQLRAEQHSAPGMVRDELNLIDQSLRTRDVMSRIRSATPAGSGAARSSGT